MRIYHLFIAALFCIVVACTKKKDDAAEPQTDPPVTNNPDKPTDTTNMPPKAKPVFTDFAPANAFIGDTITITGVNFETGTFNNTVRFGTVIASVISASSTQLQVVVPDDIEAAKTNIKLTFGDTTITVNKNFSLKAPVIESVTPTVGFARQFIEIKGKGFRKSYKFDQVSLGTYNVEKSAIDPGHTKLLAPVPDNLKAGKYPINVTVAGMTVTATDQFLKLEPAIQSLSATTIPEGSELIIKGENFIDPNGSTTQIYLFDWQTNALSTYPPAIATISNNEIKVKLLEVKAGNYKVSVRVVGSMVSYSSPLTIVKR
ncbi:MAG TPA: IPT/TIG domain-containing protein [Niastella sp.]